MQSKLIWNGLLVSGLILASLSPLLNLVELFHNSWTQLVGFILGIVLIILGLYGPTTTIRSASSCEPKDSPMNRMLPNQITPQYLASLSPHQRVVLKLAIYELSSNSNTTLFTKSTGASITPQSQSILERMNGWMWAHGYMSTSTRLEELPFYPEIQEYIDKHLTPK